MTGPDAAGEYFPSHGDLSYDVEHYELVLDYKVDTNHLAGRATLQCRAVRDTPQVTLDLHGLRVGKVVVDGAAPGRFRHRDGRLEIRTAAPLAAGQAFQVLVTYSGHPSTVDSPVADHGEGAGWEELTDGVLVAAQPDGAPAWFPCNDRPDNKASYRFVVSTPSAYCTVANGVLVGRRRTSSRTVWEYEQVAPMSTYLATLQIGRYASRLMERVPVPMLVHAPARLASAATDALVRQPEMMRAFCDLFGPYPFAEYTVVVTDDDLEIPLESQTLSTFGPNHLSLDWSCQRLIAHELAHQWFGNAVTAHTWRDIWLHEGFACYSEWLWSQASGAEPASHHAQLHWRRLAQQPQDLVLADPTPQRMFDDRVYKRGALLLHAVRVLLGDAVFFDALRSWVAEHLYATATTEQLVAHFERAAGPHGSVVRATMARWLYAPRLPQLPQAPLA